jgi:1-acyl-sn-glycerol-3-phosphate acyltransferase
MPEAWVCGQAVLSRRGIDPPAYVLAYDLLFAVPGIGSFLRQVGAIPANAGEAGSALSRGACVLVYPGGDLEACRPWTQRNKIDFGGRTGFVRLALRSGVPVIPVVAHGAHHAVTVLARGDRLARALGLDRVRIKVLPLLASPLPMPAHLTLEFLPALDWTGYGPGAAGDHDLVSACYFQITGQMQAVLDRLSAEQPRPLLTGCVRLAGQVATAVAGRASSGWTVP